MKPETDRKDFFRLAMTFALQDRSYEKTEPLLEVALSSAWPEGKCPHYYHGGFVSLMTVLHLLQNLDAPQAVLDELTRVGCRIAKRLVDSAEEAEETVEWPETIEELAGGSNGH